MCRWELPTDDVEYEKGRVERMTGRKVRLHHTDLSVKTAAERTFKYIYRYSTYDKSIQNNIYVILFIIAIYIMLYTCTMIYAISCRAVFFVCPLHGMSIRKAARVQELRRFAHFLGVDVKDCLEKAGNPSKWLKSILKMHFEERRRANWWRRSGDLLRCLDSHALKLDLDPIGAFRRSKSLRRRVSQISKSEAVRLEGLLHRCQGRDEHLREPLAFGVAFQEAKSVSRP